MLKKIMNHKYQLIVFFRLTLLFLLKYAFHSLKKMILISQLLYFIT